MIGSLFAVYLTVLLAVVPRFLQGASWTRRAPRLAIGVWLAASISAVAVMILGGTLLILPLLTVGHLLLSLVAVCDVWPSMSSARPRAGDIAGMGLLAVVAARLGYATLAVGRPQRRLCRAHRASLLLVARRDPTLDVHVVEHSTPSAFCLPGPYGGQVYLSDAALRYLSPPRVAAVIEHERAHLRGHHYLLTVTAAVLARAFPRLPLFTAASRETARLVEMVADDAAARHASPHVVAAALLDLAGVAPLGPPGGVTSTLAMTGHAAADRVRRLLGPRLPLSPPARYLGAAGVAVLLLAPIAAPAAPAMVDHPTHCATRATTIAPHQPLTVRRRPPAG